MCDTFPEYYRGRRIGAEDFDPKFFGLARVFSTVLRLVDMSSQSVIAATSVNGIRFTLKSGAMVFGSSALVLLVLPGVFLGLLGLDSTSLPLVWTMRMIGVTLVALAGNMWTNATNQDNRVVLRVGVVMAVSAAGLGVLTLLLPVPLTWFSVAYAIVGFAFSLSYVFFLVQSRR